MKNILILILILNASVVLSKNVYVSNVGKNTNIGSLKYPYNSVNFALQHINKGDTCFIRGGVYHEVIKIDNIKGAFKKRYDIQAYNNEKVVFDGSYLLTNKWEKVNDYIYKQKVDKPIWQLFKNNKTLMLARWPNANFDDGSVWNMKKTWRHQDKQSELGKMYDSNPMGAEYKKSNDEGASTVDYDGRFNNKSLASTKLNFTGAIAVLNIGSWITWAQKVTKHKSGSNVFEYEHGSIRFDGTKPVCFNMLNGRLFEKKKSQGYYYLIGKMALDNNKEWFYDIKTKEVFIYMNKDEKPENYSFKGKSKDLIIEGNNCSYINIDNIDFFAATAHFKNCDNVTFNGCNFLYPTINKFALGFLNKPIETSFVYDGKKLKSDLSFQTHNVVKNCKFEYADGAGLYMIGRGDTISNNYFHDIDWTCLGDGSSGSINLFNDESSVFTYNTIYNGGNSEGVRVGKNALVTYNIIRNLSLLQHDGAGIALGVASIHNSIISHNWIYNISKAGIRFDSAGFQTINVWWGEGGTVCFNVLWNTGGLKCKGDEHLIKNNLAFNSVKGYNDIMIPRQLTMGDNNYHTITENNIANDIGGHFVVAKNYPIPGKHKNNFQGDINKFVVNAKIGDFRLKNNFSKSLGSECVGPYKNDVSNFWIPGFRGYIPQMCVPFDGAKEVSENVVFFWNKCLDAKKYLVYVSRKKENMGTIVCETDKLYYKPINIDPKHKYYWRVDVLDNKDRILKGSVWSFGGSKGENKYIAEKKKIIEYKEKITVPIPFDLSSLNLTSQDVSRMRKLYNIFWNSYNNDVWFTFIRKKLDDYNYDFSGGLVDLSSNFSFDKSGKKFRYLHFVNWYKDVVEQSVEEFRIKVNRQMDFSSKKKVEFNELCDDYIKLL